MDAFIRHTLNRVVSLKYWAISNAIALTKRYKGAVSTSNLEFSRAIISREGGRGSGPATGSQRRIEDPLGYAAALEC